MKSLGERFSFPESSYGGWRRALNEAAQRAHNAEPVTLVIGSAVPNVDFAPGEYLHRKFGVRYVMDYRDAWHLDVYTGNTVGNSGDRSTRLERRLLARATEAWFVNQPILDWHAHRYPDAAARYHVVSNGYDDAVATLPLPRKPDPASGLVFGYLGTIYGPMPLRQSLEGWRAARGESELNARSSLVIRGRLGHYVTPDAASLDTINEFAGDGVSYGGPVSKTAVSGVYNGFDALLLALSSSPYITSGKVFEYAATGLPITSVHEPTTAVSSILDGHGAWFPSDDLSAEAIAAAFIATAEYAVDATANDVTSIRKWATRYSRDHQLSPRIDQLGLDAG